jgi:hypothetical protein
MHFALPAPERRVARDRPAPGIVVVDVRAAQLIESLDRFLDRRAGDVPDAKIVVRAGRAALGAGAVVGKDNDDGVFPVAKIANGFQYTRDLRVGVREIPGEALHETSVDPTLIVA